MSTERIAEHVKFAYWVPNVSGGLVTSGIEQRTDWNYGYNKKLAQTAENNGFEYALSQVRYAAGYGAEYQHESTCFRRRPDPRGLPALPGGDRVLRRPGAAAGSGDRGGRGVVGGRPGARAV
jgi:hypothetical protein